MIIVLGYIVLLTIIVVAFLSRTQFALYQSANSAGMLQANLLAQTSVETIIGDLRDEMLAGAVNDPNSPALSNGTLSPMQVCPINADSTQPQYASAPTNSEWAAVPARVISASVPATSADYANLVKQSLSGQAFYPGTSPASIYTQKTVGGAAQGKARASNVSTTTPSTDGRYISAARWSTSALLGADLTSSQTPNWIYIDRRGLLDDGSTLNSSSGVTTASDTNPNNENFVVGRVAYNMYDTGGLLNANVIGFPSGLNGSDTVYHKGSPAWADGTVLGLSQAQVTSLVNWRNKVSQPAFSPFDNYVHNWGEMEGFLAPYRSSGSSPSTDGYFVGRQDLIQYWLYANGATSYADLLNKHPEQRPLLAKLTGFSAFSTPPSQFTGNPYIPITRPAILRYDATSGGAVGGNRYYGNDPSTGQKWRNTINPYFPSIRANAAFTRYRKVAGQATASGVFTRQVPAQKGDVLVNSRFPLSRIALLTNGGTDGNAIKRYFGLTKVSDHVWTYSHEIAVDLDHIASLREIANPTSGAPREPDFFELLQAAIDVGSLGKSCGTAGGGTDLYGRDVVPQYQIMQIGANIISQADTSGIPTEIRFGITARSFYGIKNLPYMTRMRIIMVQIAGAPLDKSTSYTYATFIQPEVWNPHDSSVPPPSDTPTLFRVVADSNGQNLTGVHNGTPFTTAPTLTPDGGGNSVATGIDFNAAAVSGNEPVLLSRTTANVYADANNPTGAPPNTSNLLGMNASTLTVSTALTAPQGFVLHNNSGQMDHSTVTFEMQYRKTVGAAWTTYAQYEYCPLEASSRVDNLSPTEAAVSAMNYGAKSVAADPRTNRFGWWMANGNQTDTGAYPFNETCRPGTAAGYGAWTMDYPALSRQQYPTVENAGWTLGVQSPLNTAQSDARTIGTISENKKGNGTYYSDADGIYRGGDGYYYPGAAAATGLMLATGNTQSRPVVLNRLFKSVGELGYVFRDTPLKSIDFFTPSSGDAGLLDVFCIDEQPDDGVVTGHVSLNTRQPGVLAAVMANTMCIEPNQTSGADIDTAAIQQSISTAITALTSGNGTGQGPVANRNEIATRIIPMLNSQLGGTGSAGKNWIIKRRLENVVRALADSTETNTWNLMVDMVVQSGRFPKTRTSQSAANFVVSGETRQWVHLAIDRATGKVVASLVESTHE